MHDAMLSALNPCSDNNKTPKELEIASELHKKELEEISKNHEKVLGTLQAQLDQYKKSVEVKENSLKELVTSYHNKESDYDKKCSELEIVKKELDSKIKGFDEEKQKLKDAFELEQNLKINELNSAYEKLKVEHATELSQIKSQSENTLKDIKEIFEAEKASLTEQLAKAHNEILVMQKNQNSLGGTQNCLEEIRELNAHLDAFKKQSQEEILGLKKQKEDLQKRAETAEEELNSLKHTMRNTQMIYDQSAKNFKQKLEKAQQLIETNENAQTELQKCKKQINELKNSLSKYENGEKRFKSLFSQKEKEIEDLKEENKQKLNNERKKALQAHENYARVKEEFEHKKAVILKEIVAKDELIENLSKQLEKTQKRTINGLTTSYMTLKESARRNSNNLYEKDSIFNTFYSK